MQSDNATEPYPRPSPPQVVAFDPAGSDHVRAAVAAALDDAVASGCLSDAGAAGALHRLRAAASVGEAVRTAPARPLPPRRVVWPPR